MKNISEYINEGLFNKDLITDVPASLYGLFGHNISFNKISNIGSKGWARTMSSKNIDKVWKSEGSLKLKGDLARFNPFLQKLTAIILKNIIITSPKQFFEDILNNEYYKIDASDPRAIEVRNLLRDNDVLFEFYDDTNNLDKEAWSVSIVIDHPVITKNGWYKGKDLDSFEMSIYVSAGFPYNSGCEIQFKINI